jgi:5-methylcytosine-specific restriction protein A
MAWPTTSRQERGYGKEWDRLRLVILRRDHWLCQCPECRGGKPGGRVTPATEVHHVVSRAQAKALRWTREQTDDPSNLISVSEACHLRIGAEEQGKTYRIKGCDATGRPLDPNHPWNSPGGPIFRPEGAATRTALTIPVRSRQSGGKKFA